MTISQPVSRSSEREKTTFVRLGFLIIYESSICIEENLLSPCPDSVICPIHLKFCLRNLHARSSIENKRITLCIFSLAYIVYGKFQKYNKVLQFERNKGSIIVATICLQLMQDAPRHHVSVVPSAPLVLPPSRTVNSTISASAECIG